MGNFTFTANNGTSVVDYIIASSSLVSCVIDFTVDTNDFSDHFPLLCKIRTNVNTETHSIIQHTLREQSFKCKWDKSKKDTFVQSLTTLFGEF